MGYIDDRISEIHKMIQEEGIDKKASDGKPNLKYFSEIIDLADNLVKAANSDDITIEDIRNFLYKKGDYGMDKSVLLKTASILRAVADHLNKEQIQKEAQAKTIVQEKLQTLGVDVEPEKVEKIAKNKEVVDVLSKISYDRVPSVGGPEDTSSAGGNTNADERFLRFLGL